LPEGQKSYSKNKPIQFDEFAPIVEWWKNRVESDLAWKVKVTDIKDWDLDIKNPRNSASETELASSKSILKKISLQEDKIKALITELEKELL
jgi:type I restriction enzyme M protein